MSTTDRPSSPSPHPIASKTDCVHAGEPKVRPSHTLTAGIAQTATFTFDDSADLERYMRGEDADPEREEYGRYGNPTVREVEKRLAALEGTDDAVLFSSGMAAVTSTILALTKAGDHVVLFRDCYRRTRQFVAGTLGRFGVTSTLVAPGDLAGLAKTITPSTKLVISESPTNPYLSCVDLAELASIVRQHRGVRSIIDATFATPVNCRPAGFGIDLVVHSATKYLAGHNDVLAGVVCGPQHLVSLVRDLRHVLGAVCDPHAAFLVGRGLKTLALRMERQNVTAASIARALERNPNVLRVFYPGLSSHPDHVVAREQMRGFGGVVSFLVKGGGPAARRVVDGCKLARIAPSLGGVETLIEQPAIMSYFEMTPEERSAIGIEDGLVRLSVGIEEPRDILADLESALSTVET
jgi:cystathionine gamma-synthase